MFGDDSNKFYVELKKETTTSFCSVGGYFDQAREPGNRSKACRRAVARATAVSLGSLQRRRDVKWDWREDQKRSY